MSGFRLILSRDARELMRAAAFRIAAAALAVLAAALAAGTAASILASDAPTASMLAGTMLYFATFLPFLVLLWAFAGPLLMKEKASGHLETLLATPLSPRSLWLAKTMTLVLPALIIAALSSALIAIAAALAVHTLPDKAAFSIAPQMLAVCLLGNPLLMAGLGALTVLLSLRAGPDAAILPSFALGFGLMAIVPAGAALRFIDTSSWAFASAYLGAGLLECCAVLLLERGLTKEKIVLSSRDD